MSSDDPPRMVSFRPEIYEVPSLELAKTMVLTPEPGTTTEERWEKETRFTVEDIGRFLRITPNTCVLDYGCGIGRMSKALIERFGCRVVGVDSSKSMRLLAPEYVLSDRFVVWSPEVLDQMIARGFRADVAICLWVVQHAFDPLKVINQLEGALLPGGQVYAINQRTRCVPMDHGYENDGFDIRGGLARTFVEESFHQIPPEVTGPSLSARSMIQVLRKRSS